MSTSLYKGPQYARQIGEQETQPGDEKEHNKVTRRITSPIHHTDPGHMWQTIQNINTLTIVRQFMTVIIVLIFNTSLPFFCLTLSVDGCIWRRRLASSESIRCMYSTTIFGCTRWVCRSRRFAWLGVVDVDDGLLDSWGFDG